VLTITSTKCSDVISFLRQSITVHNFLSAEMNVDDLFLLLLEPNGCTVDTMYYKKLLWSNVAN
jgi:hypothetical protein